MSHPRAALGPRSRPEEYKTAQHRATLTPIAAATGAAGAAFWKECGRLFPHHVDAKNFGLTLECIFSAPLPVREALVDALLPPLNKVQKHNFLTKPENKHCIIRMYLGRRCTIKLQKLHTIKLQELQQQEQEELQQQ
ncbi:hypothetical protein ACHAQC_009177 [Fusarium culmorum]